MLLAFFAANHARGLRAFLGLVARLFSETALEKWFASLGGSSTSCEQPPWHEREPLSRSDFRRVRLSRVAHRPDAMRHSSVKKTGKCLMGETRSGDYGGGVMNQTSSTDTSLSSTNRPSAETISRRAYELWEQEGRPEGNDLRHWLLAEQELAGRDGSSPSVGNDTRARASDVRPLQGTRAGAAANRDNKRASRSPFSPDKSGTTTSSGKSELAVAGRRRN